jgi:hypothetical protein
MNPRREILLGILGSPFEFRPPWSMLLLARPLTSGEYRARDGPRQATARLRARRCMAGMSDAMPTEVFRYDAGRGSEGRRA